MSKLTIKNPYGDKIIFESGGKPFRLISRNDFGNIEYSLKTEKGFLQRGVSVVSKSMQSKIQPIELAILSNSYSDLKKRLKQISNLFEPEYHNTDDLTPFTLEYEDENKFSEIKVMRAFLRSSPTLKDKPDESIKYYQKMLTTFLLPEPVWKSKYYSEELLTTQEDLFVWPVSIQDGYTFGSISQGGVEISNDGNLSSSLIVEFKGPATNPMLENLTYGESLKLNYTLETGDTAIIDTSYNEPRLLITKADGTEIKAFKYIIPEHSDLNMRIRRGINEIKFSSDDTTAVEAVIKWYRNYTTPFGGE